MEEITAEYEVEQIAPDIALRVRPRVTVAAKTDLGRVRENNEDKYEFYIPEREGQLAAKGMVFLVCDGMGGHEAGQIASEIACKTFIEVYLNHPSQDTEVAARAAVTAANRFVLDVARAIPSRRGMGTTLSGLLIVQDAAYVVQLGDSRVYRLRHGQLKQVTTDHTWVEDTVRAGLMPREAAEQHPYRHMITRAIGSEGDVNPDVFPLDLEVGDTFLICSDGVTNHVADGEISAALSDNGPGEAAWRLVTAALVGGGSDNATVVIVRVDGLEPSTD